MPITITVPKLGWSMDKGVFVGWLKKDGESVKAGEPLFTLESEKAAQEVEATEPGILRIPADAPKVGDIVPVGAVLGYLLEEDGSVSPAEASPPSSPQKDQQEATVPPEADSSPMTAAAPPNLVQAGLLRSTVTVSPRARHRAAELGVDLTRLKGSGHGGRIVESDILAARQELRESPTSAMRRLIAQRTAESFSRVPHFYLRTEVDATALLEFRERLLPTIEQQTGIRLTLTDLLLRAQALALRDCPHANAIWRDDRIVQFNASDVGLVVGLADGLRVPIVRNVDKGGLTALVRQRTALVEAARAAKLTAEAMQGGATSLSNLGNGLVDEFAAVILPPQSSILAVGRGASRPFVIGGQLAIRTTLMLCLSVDHRVMDGGPAAEFLGRIVELIVQPAELARD